MKDEIIYIVTKNGNNIKNDICDKISDILFPYSNDIKITIKMGYELNNPKKLYRKLHNKKSYCVVNIVTDNNNISDGKFILGRDNLNLLLKKLKDCKKEDNSWDAINELYDELSIK